ncbi:MAG: hypothetical protein GX877_02035 [Bacteroidales bacterium]|nr:hypothetical protein [Bacteroidales bacterium]
MRSKIQFLLNGNPVTLDFCEHGTPDPQITVLKYLRDHRKMTGTKEGCGTGDCGSCMVALAQKNTEGYTVLYAVNSCLMLLGMLDGKHLITIEGIAKNGKLHPVQEALLHRKGTQCGFCTPGVAMSSFAAYESGRKFTPESIKEILSGNLCRCTGYESIREALIDLNKTAQSLTEPNIELPPALPGEFFWEGSMGPYIKPQTVSSLLEYKRKYPGYPIVSGASDFSVKNILEEPARRPLIDSSDLEELKHIQTEEGCIKIGAGSSVEAFKNELVPLYPAAEEYLLSFASLPVRIKASIGGSLAGASSVGDIMPLLLALNAQLELRTSGGNRTVSCKAFNTGYHAHLLEPYEIIYAVRIPLPSKTTKFFAHKQSRRKDMDISTLTFCMGFEVVNGTIYHASTGFGGMAPTPVSSGELEDFLNGRSFSEDTFARASALIPQLFSTISDVRGSADYRITIASHLLVSCFLETQGRNNDG